MLLLTSICSKYYSAVQNHSFIYTYVHVHFFVFKKSNLWIYRGVSRQKMDASGGDRLYGRNEYMAPQRRNLKALRDLPHENLHLQGQ
jgi:hypothetical protein